MNDQERITPEVDAASVQKELLVWRTPEEFRALVDRLDSRTKSADLWGSNALKFMRDDAISLKEFTIHMAVDRVRLCKPPEEHDGQVEINGQVFDVQITATHGGRPVADEHRASARSACCNQQGRESIEDIRLGRIAAFAEIAERQGHGERHIRLLAPLAFLSPRIIAAIVDGTAPADLTVTGLAQALPYSWAEQEQRIGLDDIQVAN
jgi:hypothetical protein